jgi:hypothetical protein
MKTVWVWVFGIVIALMVIGLLFFGGADRRAYRRAKGVVEQRVALQQDRIDTAVAMAIKGVDLALVRAGDLPSQQAAADLVKQDITEIGERLKDGAELRGDAAVAQLDQSIERFNTALQAVDDASKQAEDPLVKAKLDRIHGMLEATKEQLVETVLKVPAASTRDLFGHWGGRMALSSSR